MNLIPVNKRIIIKRTAAATLSPGGIALPESGQQTTTYGVVIAFDSEIKLPICVGMLVVFGKYAGSEFKVAGKDYLIIKDEELIALVNKDDK